MAALSGALLFLPLAMGADCRFGASLEGIREQDGRPVFPGREWVKLASSESAGFSSRNLEAVAARIKQMNTTSLMVVKGGRVLLECGNLSHVSYLASVRKSVLAMLYGRYVENGTIRLDRTLEDLQMDDHGGLLPIERQATVEHLISARSGVYHPASNPGDSLAHAPPRGSQQPGDYYLYSNWDFNAAGAAFERQTGLDIFDALERDLALPLNMQDFDRARQRKLGDLTRSRYPAYHMWLSTRDMARLGYLMLRRGNWEGAAVVPADWIDRIVSLRTPLEEMNPEPLRQETFGYGYMWWVWDGPAAVGAYRGAYTARGAFGQFITVLPELDLVIAHKTDPDPQAHPGMWNWLRFRLLGQRPFVPWDRYQAVLDGLVAAPDRGMKKAIRLAMFAATCATNWPITPQS